MSGGIRVSVEVKTGKQTASNLSQEDVDFLELCHARMPKGDPDLSNSDELVDVLKALLACIAQVGGLTQQQAKDMFKQKYQNISGGP